MALKLARAGYWGGDPESILRAPIGMVMSAVQYEDFCGDYEAADFEMQKMLAGHG